MWRSTTGQDAEGAEETASLVRAAERQALVVQADVGDPAQVAAMFQRFDDELGAIDVLVANAGHASTPKPCTRRHGMNGSACCVRTCMARFSAGAKRRGGWSPAGSGGRIVNISSVHEEACNVPNDGAYCVAKGGIRNLTRAMALELGPHGITVNDVAPGMILTPMNQRALEDPAYLAGAEAQIPVRRAGTPADIASNGPLPLFRACVLLYGRNVSRRWRLDADLAAGVGKEPSMSATRRGLIAGGTSALAMRRVPPGAGGGRPAGRPRSDRSALRAGAGADRLLHGDPRYLRCLSVRRGRLAEGTRTGIEAILAAERAHLTIVTREDGPQSPPRPRRHWTTSRTH